ncbi:hypothetical protein [Bacillus weihaiensis]|uniref:Uncharacterized protein n=1 Tax=Bacillus weihaiensis TaxID=1547283 RepID=A0A1L3MVA2_9BACI|nr:hypothetical protein [Bacillus weihaiensis]APH06262.1 hypothetical protein A9C19_16855 [Bacillus weihaiensis]
MRRIALILQIISIVIIFFNYNFAIFLFGMVLLLLGGYHLQTKSRMMSYIYFVSRFIFIIGILITGFGFQL